MSQFEKLLRKLVNPTSILTFQELEFLLRHLGYIEKKTGKTAGSRKAYIHPINNHILRIHKPHPGNELKKYVKLYLIKELKREQLI